MMHDLDSYLEDNILKDNSWADSAEKSTKQGYSQLELIGDLVLQSPAQTHKANRQSEGYSRTRELIQLQEISFIPELPDLETYFYSYFFKGSEPQKPASEPEFSFVKIEEEASGEADQVKNSPEKLDDQELGKIEEECPSPQKDQLDIHNEEHLSSSLALQESKASKSSSEDDPEEEASQDQSSVESNPYEDKHFYDKSDDSGIL